MPSQGPTNAAVVETCSQRLRALKADVQPNDVISLNGVPHTPADVIAVYQTSLDTRAAIVNLRSQLKVALAARASAESARLTTDKALKSWVDTKFGANSQQAHDFGFHPPKPRVTKALSKAHAVLQNRATREARHTVGPKKKLATKGSVPPLASLEEAALHAPSPSGATNGVAVTPHS